MLSIYDISYSQIVIDNSIHYTSDPKGIITLNMHPVVGKYIGFFYTIIAHGGFYIKQTFPTLNLIGGKPSPDTFQVVKYDVTNALQIIFSTDFFNKKLGAFILKNNKFSNDNITITSKEFISNISASQIISLGLFTDLYKNFIHYVNNYFSYAAHFTTLFSSDNQFSYKDTEFDANSFIELINNSYLDVNENIVPQITGEITLKGLNGLLQYLNKTNILGNRSQHLVENGFVDGDLILIPDGITITLGLDMDFSSLISRNEITKIKRALYKEENNCKNKYINKNLPFQALSNIQRTITAPLMLKLQKL